MARRVLCAGVFGLAATSIVKAQVGPPATQMVNVEGRAMRVAVAGLEQRKPGQPVLILEAGAGETGIETWTRIRSARTRRAGAGLRSTRHRTVGARFSETDAQTYGLITSCPAPAPEHPAALCSRRPLVGRSGHARVL
jgi:hypothetical protein